MAEKPMKIVVINRSFWPVYPVIGEALLRFVEDAASCGHSVSVIMQDYVGIKVKLAESDRGKGVRFFPAKALTISSSGIFLRVCEAVFFMFWVMGVLLWEKPQKIYVSTDPPVVVPFIVMLYSRLFGAEYIYHLQDIHPEAANVVISVNKWVYKILLKMDAQVMRKAKCLITITKEMAAVISSRSGTTTPIHLMDNPAISFDGIDTTKPKTDGFSFCGNAGRLQRIPLLLNAIEVYFHQGGQLDFVFAGGGMYANQLKRYSERFPHFYYRGVISSIEAAQISTDYTWALLPIEDDVTSYSFPSKSSSYVFSGANILAICGEQTAVSQWVKKNGVGLVVRPEVDELAGFFLDIERGVFNGLKGDCAREILKEKLGFDAFVNALGRIVLESHEDTINGSYGFSR